LNGKNEAQDKAHQRLIAELEAQKKQLSRRASSLTIILQNFDRKMRNCQESLGREDPNSDPRDIFRRNAWTHRARDLGQEAQRLEYNYTTAYEEAKKAYPELDFHDGSLEHNPSPAESGVGQQRKTELVCGTQALVYSAGYMLLSQYGGYHSMLFVSIASK
jgi:hypothetical protein